ncbi:MAG: hypothetical protein ACO1N7_09345 [Sphingobacteriaceae bacterium]
MYKNLTIQKIKSIALGALFFSTFSCNDKPPFKPDYENAVGLIIGSEDCKQEPSQNAWFIQFSGPNAGNKSYGENITYNAKSYSNVVKTYTLPDSSKVAGKRYLVDFYIEEKTNSQVCDVDNAVNLKIVNIRIKNLARIAN